jgi:hypothetical protein
LEVPTTVWADVAIDFVEGLQRVNRKSVILTIINRFFKYRHFLPLGQSYTTKLVACLFFDNVVKLHGIPSSIVSDWDLCSITGIFWRELFKLAKVKLHKSSMFNPKSDGQSEVANKIIAMYRWYLVGKRPRTWLQ